LRDIFHVHDRVNLMLKSEQDSHHGLVPWLVGLKPIFYSVVHGVGSRTVANVGSYNNNNIWDEEKIGLFVSVTGGKNDTDNNWKLPELRLNHKTVPQVGLVNNHDSLPCWQRNVDTLLTKNCKYPLQMLIHNSVRPHTITSFKPSEVTSK
jgi:hypothetical protein